MGIQLVVTPLGTETTCPQCFARELVEIAGLRLSAPEVTTIMAEAAEQFHRLAGTIGSVHENLERLRSGAITIRFAHQPNLLPYLGVLGQFTHIYLLSAFAAPLSERGAVPAYFVMDYDGGAGRRFVNSLLPDPQARHGAAKLKYRTKGPSHHRVAFSLEAPPPATLARWSATFESWAERYSPAVDDERMADLHHPALAELESARDALQILGKCYLATDRFAMGNTAFLSVIVNEIWDLPVLFIPLSRCVTSLQPQMLRIARHLASVLPESPFQVWKICPVCFSRNATSAVIEDSDDRCVQCRSLFDVASLPRPLVGDCIFTRHTPLFFPRVVADDLADYAIYRVPGGTTYQSSLRHLEQSRPYMPPDRKPGIELGLQFSSSNDKNTGKKSYKNLSGFRANEIIRTGRASMLYYLSMFGYSGMKDELLAVSAASMCENHVGGQGQ
ncbi:hypothetical protein [Pseudofrankia sp. BMG5.37]|uniref:hypothetical protein n=1 Tax=Pseudofrankia sp. BMG5.37 TaxID=3050035 RepID=UPI002895A355|nr:hypothetical protein [Pseudofrankia sp. BMG5.37]MDT3444015.1 hypothetical protein [Pseudofrankia sp. BMG5.37]